MEFTTSSESPVRQTNFCRFINHDLVSSSQHSNNEKVGNRKLNEPSHLIIEIWISLLHKSKDYEKCINVDTTKFPSQTSLLLTKAFIGITYIFLDVIISYIFVKWRSNSVPLNRFLTFSTNRTYSWLTSPLLLIKGIFCKSLALMFTIFCSSVCSEIGKY